MKKIENLNDIKKIGLWLAKPKAVFYVLIWLIVLLFIGTIAQKYIGLYQSQNLFFSSWFFMFGPIPFPGGIPTLGFLTICLSAKLFLASKWSWKNSGVIITHIGALLLLVGGMITYVSSQEGNMVIFEGEKSGYFSDYHIRELVVEDKDNGNIVDVFAWEELQKGKSFSVSNTPINIEIINLCKNCNIFPREELEEDNDESNSEFKGMARRMDISPAKLEKDDEANRGAIQFRVSGSSEEKNGIHFSADFIDISPWVDFEDKQYNIALRYKRTPLPFEIELIDFEKRMHPGTNTPKSYKSEIILHENEAEWKSVIQMNDPLRYRGYTFFQSSFIEREDEQATVFAVVKNAGRTFPYISSIVMCIGLLIHVILRMPKLINKATKPLIVFFAITLSAVSFPHSGSAYAKDLSFDEFSQIPVLDQGRVKPLDTFARTYLEIINGKDELFDKTAIEWLAETVFDPEKSYKRTIFKISNPRVVDALELENRKDHRYSYIEISGAFYNQPKMWKSLFTIPEEKMSLQQKQLLELFTKTQMYADLSRSLSLLFNDFMVPDGELAEALDVKAGEKVNFFKLRSHQELIKNIAERVEGKSKKSNYKPSRDDILTAILAIDIKDMNRDKNSNVFKVIPPQWDKAQEGYSEDGRWFSPWGIGFYGQGSPESINFLGLWSDLVDAYRQGDNAKWDDLVSKIREIFY